MSYDYAAEYSQLKTWEKQGSVIYHVMHYYAMQQECNEQADSFYEQQLMEEQGFYCSADSVQPNQYGYPPVYGI